jgi:hypothetical protein
LPSHRISWSPAKRFVPPREEHAIMPGSTGDAGAGRGDSSSRTLGNRGGPSVRIAGSARATSASAPEEGFPQLKSGDCADLPSFTLSKQCHEIG